MRETIQVTMDKGINPDGINGLYTLHIFAADEDYLCVLENGEMVVKEWRCDSNRATVLEIAKRAAIQDFSLTLQNYIMKAEVVDHA